MTGDTTIQDEFYTTKTHALLLFNPTLKPIKPTITSTSLEYYLRLYKCLYYNKIYIILNFNY